MPVTAHRLGHRFGDHPWLFRGIDLRLDPGRVYALTGPSGSGKSTLLAILAGWVRPSEGEVTSTVTGRTSWVFQNPHGAPRRTALDHVALPLLARGMSTTEADRRATELIARVGLSAQVDRPFHVLSGGEAQRLMLARGMAAAPGLLLVDEPTAQLDTATGAEVNHAISVLATSGTVIVVATHDERTRAACTDHLDLPRLGGVR